MRLCSSGNGEENEKKKEKQEYRKNEKNRTGRYFNGACNDIFIYRVPDTDSAAGSGREAGNCQYCHYIGIVSAWKRTGTACQFAADYADGNFNSFLFSMAGGMLSLLVMVILKKSGHFSIVGVSVAGGVFHNVGQITAAVFLMDTTAIYYYLPVLLIFGIVTGIIIGLMGGYVTQRVYPVVGEE